MSRHTRTPLVMFLIALAALPGCHPTQPFYFHNDHDLSHYLDKATDVEHPDADHARLAEVDNVHAPFTLSNPEFTEIWDVSLEEAISIALHNSKVIRNAASIQANFGFSDPLIGRTAGLNTVYDTAIAETTTGSSNRANLPLGTNGRAYLFSPNPTGVEDALSAFDAQFSVVANYGVTNRPQNFTSALANFQTSNLQQNGSSNGSSNSFLNASQGNLLIAQLTKQTATGAVFGVRTVTDYDYSNQPSRIFRGDWTQSLEFEWDQPLLRGAGTMINRIPVTLARINTDISLADFEASVRNMMMDLENAYWDLHFAYRSLEAAKIGRDSAQATWKIVYEKFQNGLEPSQAEAQARGQYYQGRAAAETALRDVYSGESRLRWMMGLAATDGRLIRPKDEPTLARVDYEWCAIHAEALFRSAELRQQKWRIKQREISLIAAKNRLLPDLDVYANHKFIGRGDNWWNADPNGLAYAQQGSTAVDVLTQGDYQEGGVGLRFTPPRIGARQELAGIRNAQLGLAREKARLEEMELNQSHLMTLAVREVDANFTVAQSHFNRWLAAEKEVDSAEALYLGGQKTLDIVLDAQRRRATAQVDYYKALTDYNKSLAFVHYRKGSLLEHNNVLLSEGPWPQKAYWDAVGHARERDSSYYLNYGYSRPRVVSRGPVEQIMGEAEMNADGPGELLPTPTPTPATKPAAEEPAPATKPGPITSVDPLRIREPAPRSAAKSPVIQASAEDEIAEPASRESSPPQKQSQPSRSMNALRSSQSAAPTGNGLR